MQGRLGLYIGILFRTRSLVSPAKCGERSESEANFCVRSAVRHRVGRVAGGRSAIRNGICPLQTLPRLFCPKSTTSRLDRPRRRGGNEAPLTSSASSSTPPPPPPTGNLVAGSRAEPASSTRGKFTLELHFHHQALQSRALSYFLFPSLALLLLQNVLRFRAN